MLNFSSWTLALIHYTMLNPYSLKEKRIQLSCSKHRGEGTQI